MKKTFSILFVSLTVALMISGTVRRSSSGAPASHTGAPGEQTCAASGCHDDGTLNSGNAAIDLYLNDIRSFVPDSVYDIKVKISEAERERFGFQIVALDSKSSDPAGQFIITDSIRTQLVKNAYKLKDREYVTYTFVGTDAVSRGKGEWIMKWKAPSKSGSVTFYVAAVSANDDMSDKGDQVYLRELKINSKK